MDKAPYNSYGLRTWEAPAPAPLSAPAAPAPTAQPWHAPAPAPYYPQAYQAPAAPRGADDYVMGDPGWTSHGAPLSTELASNASAHQLATALTHVGIDDPTVVGALVNSLGQDFGDAHRFDRGHRDEVATELRQLWGHAYEQNVQTMKAYVDRLPKGIANALFQIRLPNGRALLNEPSIVVELFFVASRGAPIGKLTGDVDKDLQMLEDAMRAHPDAWAKDPAARLLQLDLLGQRGAKR